MKKILFVTRPIAPPWDEASKNFALSLAKKLENYACYVLSAGVLPDLPPHVHAIPLYTSPRLDFIQRLRLLKLRRLILKIRPDIIHFLFTPNKLNSFFFRKIVANSRAKTVQTVATLREDLYGAKDLRSIMFADRIVTYSDLAKDKLLALGIPNVGRVYPGIDLDEYRIKSRNAPLMKRYGFAPDDFILNFTGEYSRLGAIDDIIGSFVEIAAEIPSSKLSLAVRVKSQKDARKKREIAGLLQRKNLLRRVAFHDDGSYAMSDIYNLCDVSLFPVGDMRGKFDVPLAVIEAMACQKPVIVSDIPVLTEFANRENSVIVKPGDVKNLVETVISLFRQPDLRAALGAQARSYVEKNFDIKLATDAYADIYRNM